MKNENIMRDIRKTIFLTAYSASIAHIASAFSIVEILYVLYSNKILKVDSKNPNMVDRDKFILSKGHGSLALYTILCREGFFDENILKTFAKPGSILGGEPTIPLIPGVEATTGSLGQGISCALGLALGSKIKNDNATIYAIIGDGESQEGQVWEAAFFAGHKKLDNLIVFLDYNKMQLDGTLEEVNDSGNMYDKFKSFGFDTYSIDGHNIDEIIATIEKAKTVKGMPHMIVLNTIKGKGVSFAEAAKANSHSMPISKEALEEAIKELS
jgi:transketolase